MFARDIQETATTDKDVQLSEDAAAAEEQGQERNANTAEARRGMESNIRDEGNNFRHQRSVEEAGSQRKGYPRLLQAYGNGRGDRQA